MQLRTARFGATLIALTLLPAAAASAADTRRARDAAAERALAKVERISTGRARAANGRELSHLLRELALGYTALRGADRAEARSLLARPDGDPPSSSDPNFADYSPGQPAGLLCDARFCVHYADDPGDVDAPDLATDDNGNGTPDSMETMLQAFATSADRQNDQLGWPAPVSDGAFGGDARTDVYVLDLDIEHTGVLGYSAPDPRSTQVPESMSLHAYLVMDNDYMAPGSGLDTAEERAAIRESTAAHEYNHVLQYAIDVLNDPWMFEATAVWMEEQVFPANDDYVDFLGTWAQLSQVPLTTFTQDLGDPASQKAYGDAVWLHWAAQRFGADVVRQAWLRAPGSNPPHFAPGAWDTVLRMAGGNGFATEFACFAAATGEWRSTAQDTCAGRSTLFPDAAAAGYPDMVRVISTPAVDGAPVMGGLSHTGYALFRLPLAPGSAYKLIGELPEGTSSAVAFVGRRGDRESGAVTLRMAEMPSGGRGSVLVDAPSSFTEITGVLVNSDTSQSGFSSTARDWAWLRDGQPASIRISSDVTAPAIASRSPAPGAARVPVGARVTVGFSEAVTGVTGTSMLLTRAGRAVPARLTASGSRATLTPRGQLAQRARYTVALTGAVTDASDNHLAPVTWTFTTVNLPPVFSLSGPSRQRGADARRRGVRLLIRSGDSERISITVRAVGPGRSAGPARRLRMRPRSRRSLRVPLSGAARAALANGQSVRLRLRVDGRDATRKRKRRTRTITVSG